MKGALLPVLVLTNLFTAVQGLYFYLEGPSQKCFFEDLPKDTLVVGQSWRLARSLPEPGSANYLPGHYSALQWNDQSRSYGENRDMGIFITVDEIFDHDHRVISQKGSASGKFTFSAADSGEHRICFQPTNVPSAQGWLHHGAAAGNIKLTLDMTTGETSKIESSDKAKLDSIVGKVQDLNARLKDIRREQVFQRVRQNSFVVGSSRTMH